MHPSVLLTSFPADFATAARQAVGLGFRFIDVVALTERPAADLDVLAETGLHVACASLGRGLPPDQALDAPVVGIRRAVLQALKQQVADAARLGATHAYLVPGLDATMDGLARFQESCCLLADFAAGRMIRLCIEHIPGRALPSVAATLTWIQATGHPNLRLLLDVGHCAISKEDPVEAINQGGDFLGYVHLDDNDGAQDLHWPLLAGCLTRAKLEAAVAALRRVGYDGALSLELASTNPNLLEALRRGKTLLEELIQFVQAREPPHPTLSP
jgi:sugar phosphate isomerase/epimerase